MARIARPAFNSLDAERDRDTAEQARVHGASAIFGGGGGDAVFFQMPSALVLEDLRRSQGRLPLGEPLVLDVARWLRRSTWRVRSDARRGAAHDPDAVAASFWGPRAREPVRGVRHPWLEDLEAAPPGKRLQIAALTAMQPGWGRSRRGDAARIQQPLLSQPVVEACLAIPTWQLVQGGRERGLARLAFADDLPASVVERRGKGALTSLYSRRAAASLPFLRTHLMDGVLAEAGVLDRDRTDAALQADRLIWRSEGASLMRAAMVESWVRHWQGQAPDLATASRWGRRA